VKAVTHLLLLLLLLLPSPLSSLSFSHLFPTLAMGQPWQRNTLFSITKISVLFLSLSLLTSLNSHL
jgi:hypothetical protein